jgi:hypothetical protein
MLCWLYKLYWWFVLCGFINPIGGLCCVGFIVMLCWLYKPYWWFVLRGFINLIGGLCCVGFINPIGGFIFASVRRLALSIGRN